MVVINSFVEYRDVIDKEIDIEEGDYLSYGITFFEVVKATIDSIIIKIRTPLK